MIPFEYIGKEVERRAQEGEDLAVFENTGPIQYRSRLNAKSRSADPTLIGKGRRYGLRQLMRQSGASQHANERYLRGERVHPGTRARLEEAVRKLRRDGPRLQANNARQPLA